MNIFNLVSQVTQPDSATPALNPCGEFFVLDGAKMMIGSKSDDNVKPYLIADKETIETAIKRDSVFHKSKEYDEWTKQCELSRLELLDQKSLALQTEMNSRLAAVEMIMAALNDTFNAHDKTDQIKINLDLKNDPKVKKFLETPFGLQTDFLVDIISCKISDRAEDHTFEDFRAVCKTFLQNICGSLHHVKWASIWGEGKEYTLSILFTPQDSFIKMAKEHYYNEPLKAFQN